MAEPTLIWAPQAGPQKALIDCPVPEILFGGARGGGKTDGVLGKHLIKALRYGAGFNGILFRRTMPAADDVWERAKYLWGGFDGKPNEQEKSLRLPSGARLRLRPLERTEDADKYQGQNVTDVGIEEAGQYPDPAPIDRLHGILRSTGGVPTQMILTANPGGAGQAWIKQRYIDPAPQGMVVKARELGGGKRHQWVFIPSKVQDNRILLASDPEYLTRLQLVGSPQLVKAWLEGDWTAIEGAFFPEWSYARHVVDPFTVPQDWLRFRAMDWGSAAPFAVQWFAVVGDDYALPDGRVMPRGALLIYREWYGADGQGKGLRLTADEVASGIVAREVGENIAYGVLDPAAFAVSGGPSIAEMMARAGARFRPADNKRLGPLGALSGWDQVRARLKGDGERPGLFVFHTAKDLIRTLPLQQHDTARPEDIDTDGEDHAADACRYGCMSRPWVPQAYKRPGPIRRNVMNELTVEEAFRLNEPRKANRI